MGDFFQGGPIATMHNLKLKSTERLEQELINFGQRRPIGLVLPSLFSELEGEALAQIISELKKVPYLSQIIIGLDKANKADFEFAKKYFSNLPQKHAILWHDGPRLKELAQELADNGLAPPEPGKGRNVWYCFGYLLGTRSIDTVGLHDCDIVTYTRDMLARLLYPVANPLFPYVFSKGYYPRVDGEKFGGRVTRLFVSPLINALQKICGRSDYLSYIESFRYPLAGEFAMRVHLLPDLRIPSDWGLEIGVLSEVMRHYNYRAITQVEIADIYDHKHQKVSFDDNTTGLNRMSVDIAKAIFRKLATEGEVFSIEKFRTIKATFYREALDKIENYSNDAIMNGLKIDRHGEEEAVELFASNIMTAGETFLNNPMETPVLKAWSRVHAALPGFIEKYVKGVQEDNA